MALTNNGALGIPPTPQVAGAFTHMAPVTPSDTTVGFGSTSSLATMFFTHSGGTIAFVLAGDNVAVPGDAHAITVAANTWIPVCAKQVLATGTTIGDLTAFW